MRDICRYGLTSQEVAAFLRDPRTWHYLLRVNYGFDYSGAFPKQAYELAEIVWSQHPPHITISKALTHLVKSEDVLKAFATQGRFTHVRASSAQSNMIREAPSFWPEFVFRNVELKMILLLEPIGFQIEIIPTSREYGHFTVGSAEALTDAVIRFLCFKIAEYTKFLAVHPSLPPHPLHRFWKSRAKRNDHLIREFRQMRQILQRDFNFPLGTIHSYTSIGPSSPPIRGRSSENYYADDE